MVKTIRPALRRCSRLGDYYALGRELPDGEAPESRWDFQLQRLVCSTQLSNYFIEGPASEMLAIARAIEQRSKRVFRRCAVDARKSEVRLWSPAVRNSKPVRCTQAFADLVAAEIRRSL